MEGIAYAILASRFAEAGELAKARSVYGRAKGKISAGRQIATYYPVFSAMDLHEAMSRALIAELNGEYSLAEAHYREAERHATPGGSGGLGLSRETVRSHLGRVLVRQGKLMEAEVEVRSAIRRSNVAGDQGRLVTALANIVYEQGRYAEATRLVKRALLLYGSVCVPEDSLPYALTRAAYARALAGQERWGAANAQFDALRRSLGLTSPAIYQRRFAGDLDMGVSLLRAGRVAAGVTTMETAYQQISERLGEAHYESAVALAFLGYGRLAEGNLKSALSAFRESMPRIIDRRRAASDFTQSAVTQERRLRIIFEAYIKLLDRIRGTPQEALLDDDPVEEMFRVADVARSSSVQSAIAAASARSVADPELAALVRDDQDAKHQIEATYALLFDIQSYIASEPDPAYRQLVTELQVRLSKLKSAQDVLNREIERRFPKYASRINPRPATVQDVQRALKPSEALIATYVAEDATYVWTVPAAGAVAITVSPLGRPEIRGKVDHLRRALEPDAEMLGDIPDFDVKAAYSLYRELFQPAAATWRGARQLVLVAHDSLGQLPLGVLPTEATILPVDEGPTFSRYQSVPWWVRSHAIALVPSVAAFREQRQAGERHTASRPFIGFGDPWFSKPLDVTPVAEVGSVGNRGVIQEINVRMRQPVGTRQLSSAVLSAPAGFDDFQF